MSSFVFLSLLLGWVVAWPNPHLPICGLHLALKVITFKIIVHCNLYESSFLLVTFLLFFLFRFLFISHCSFCVLLTSLPEGSHWTENLHPLLLSKEGQYCERRKCRSHSSSALLQAVAGFLNTCLFSILLHSVTCRSGLLVMHRCRALPPLSENWACFIQLECRAISSVSKV